MEHIKMHITGPTARKEKATERGDMMQYFLKKLNAARVRDGLSEMSMGRMARLLLAIPTKDLYYLKSICDMAPDFSKKFWWEINPKKHTPEAKAATQKAWEQKNKFKNNAK